VGATVRFSNIKNIEDIEKSTQQKNADDLFLILGGSMRVHSSQPFFLLTCHAKLLTRALHGACAMFIALAMSACATYQPVDMKPEMKQSFTEVTLIEMPGPFKHLVLGVDPLSAKIGPVELELEVDNATFIGIAAGRMAMQASSLTKAVNPYLPRAGAVLANELEAELTKRGVKVTRMAAPANFKLMNFDYTSLNIKTPYILEATLHTSYQVQEDLLSPVVISRVRLLDKTGKQEHYKNVFSYAEPNEHNDNVMRIQPDIKYVFEDLDKLYANGKIAAEAFETAIKLIAMNVGQQLK
jgi:hypothetical protein